MPEESYSTDQLQIASCGLYTEDLSDYLDFFVDSTKVYVTNEI